MSITHKRSQITVEGQRGAITQIDIASEFYQNQPLASTVTIGPFNILPEDQARFLTEQARLIKRYAG